MRFPAVALIAVLALLSPGSFGADRDTLHVLTIGNSFTANALEYLPRLARSSGGKNLVLGYANLGDAGLERHWRHVEAFESDLDGTGGRRYRLQGEPAGLRELLTAEQWDVVTLQQVSYKSFDPATYYPYVDQLHEYILTHAPGATVMLHQTWAYRVDDPWFTGGGHSTYPATQAAMYRKVADAYRAVAADLGVKEIPGGDAMYLADTDARWGYRPDTAYDFDNPPYPELPAQAHSLQRGWRWAPGPNDTHVLRIDGRHASDAGKYLLGCVWFAALFGEPVADDAFVPPGIDPDYAAFLRGVAAKAANPAATP